MSSQTDQTELFKSTELVRSEWISASRFHDLSEEEVLREVARRVSEVKAKAGSDRQAHPLVLLDLDSTLYEVGPRTHQILREWVASPESESFSSVRAAVARTEATHVGYSLKDTFAALGLELQQDEVHRAWQHAKKFWSCRFFTSGYLKYDHAYSGAAEFCREVHALGAELVYLTGRDEPNMGDG